MTDFLMNDTLENFNLAQILPKTFSGVTLNDNNGIQTNLYKKTQNNDISFDDSMFLSQVILSGNDNSIFQKNTITGTDHFSSKIPTEKIFSKSALLKSSFNEDIKNNESTKINEKVPLDVKEEESIPKIKQKQNKITEAISSKTNKLSFWGLPKNVLKMYESKNVTQMFSWQVECLSQCDVLNGKNLVYSAPTSAGKTLVAEILAIKTIIELKKKVIFILPFISIVREKMFYFQSLLETSGIRVDGFMGSYNPPGGFQSIQLAICTIEKANSLINRLLEEGKLSDIGAVLIDELHLLGDSSRGYLLELLLTKLRYISKKNDISIQIIGMSATLPNLKQIAKWLDAELYTTNFRPVPLNEQAYVSGEIYDKHLKLIRKLDLLPDLKTDSDNILQLCLETIRISRSVLIFCPTKNWCENLAQQIATGFFKIGSSIGVWADLLRTQLDTNLIIEVLEQLKFCPVGLDEILKKTVSFGVAFHHAGLTMDERDIIEGAFRNGALRVLVATSTLSSGVNLPARRVIIRTPIFHGHPLDPLIYQQMIGRAGRMGKDSLGESFLICQKSDYKIAKDLMSSELTPVKSCLESAGKLKRAILEVVASGVASTPQDIQVFTESTLLATENDNSRELSNPIDEAKNFLLLNEFIKLQKQEDCSERYVPTSLGKACLSSSVAPDEGLSLFTELEKARQCLVLETELHLIYLVTPYNACYSWENIDWMLYLNIWEKLPSNMKKVGELIGIREVYIIKATRKKNQTVSGKEFHKYLIHKRFFIALALQDLVNEKPLSWVCQKFNCNRGMLQSLQQSASSFAGMVTAFSRQLGWNSMELLFSQFQDRMHFGVSRDLLDLMHLPILNGKMARSLFNSGIETIIQLANSEISSIENILHRVVPFESEKIREGESEFEKHQRNKYRNVWITGREGLTEREAADIFVTEARKYLEIEMGLIDAKWNDKDKANKNITTEVIVFDSKDETIETKIADTEEVKEVENENKICKTRDIETKNKYEESYIDNKLKGKVKINKIVETEYNVMEDDNINNYNYNNDSKLSHAADLSKFSNDLNISDSSNISNTDSTKIEEEVEERNEISNRLSERLKKFTIHSPKGPCKIDERKHVNNLLKEISLSDFSDTLSETSQFTPKTVSHLIKPSLAELHISQSPLQTDLSISLEKMLSDQSLFEESFNLKLSEDISSEDSAVGFIKEDNQIYSNESLEKVFIDSFDSSDDVLGKSIEEVVPFSAKKRKPDTVEESTIYKKIRNKEDSHIQKVEDVNNTYILNKVENPCYTDFSKLQIVNVCQELTLLEAFSDKIKEQTFFSFSIACRKFTESKSSIGMNLINNKSEVQNTTFTFEERKIEGFSFCWEENTAYYLNLDKINFNKKILKLFKMIFKKTDTTVRIFDSKEQIKLLKNCCGINFCCKLDDPKVMEWILNPEGKESNLKSMVLKYFPEGVELTQLSGGCKGVGSVGLDVYSNVEPRIRSSLESILTWHLIETLKRIFTKENPKYLKICEIETDVIIILAKIESNGFSLNSTKLKTVIDTLKLQISNTERSAYSLAGRKFNFASSADVAKVTGMYKGKKVSTRKQILEKSQHPISNLVLLWRKLHSTLTKTIYPLIQATKEQRIHGCYITHTATGRISMHEPNLQNITKDFSVTIENVKISCREVFEAPEGCTLVSADYCQLELRILTHFSQDKLLMKIMGEPGDVFCMIAAKWNNIRENEVTDDIRQSAKHLCYGIIYGMGSKTLADQLSIEEFEATEFMETFRDTYPGVKVFMKETIEKCRNCGYVETINGRKRFLEHINQTDPAKKAQAERQAVNTIVQGSAADIVKSAMIKMERELEELFNKTINKPKMVLHLHDELMYEVPNKYLIKVAKIIKKCMENSGSLSIPLPVKLKSGKSWGNMSELIL